ncbi:hypothetical protein VaNZ11_005925 [Volvox africanus]|uniref:Uncharacterized protein n=1 Tax=Volvox africanus TaxID=51714 RepID=A0ABQ5S0Y4_9CHLO|nr:hypothetical protein VaNZ11_005925 [Volvox africanus]
MRRPGGQEGSHELLPGLLSRLGELRQGLGVQCCPERVQVNVTDPATVQGLARHHWVRFEQGASIAHQGGILWEQGPGREAVNALAQGSQLGWGGLYKGEVERKGISQDLLGDMDPAYEAQAVAPPHSADVVQPLDSAGVAEVGRLGDVGGGAGSPLGSCGVCSWPVLQR